MACQGLSGAQRESFVLLHCPSGKRTERRACLALRGGRAGVAWHSRLGKLGTQRAGGWGSGVGEQHPEGLDGLRTCHFLPGSQSSNVTVGERAEKDT